MKLAFALMAAINAGFTKTEARPASWRPRSDSRFSLADSESGTAAIRPAWATMGKPGRSTTDSRFDPIVCSQAASNRSDVCSDSAQGRSLVDGNDMRVARQKRESAADACARLGVPVRIESPAAISPADCPSGFSPGASGARARARALDKRGAEPSTPSSQKGSLTYTACDPAGASRSPRNTAPRDPWVGPKPVPILGRALSAWSRTWSGPRRRETSGSPPRSGSPSCPGP